MGPPYSFIMSRELCICSLFVQYLVKGNSCSEYYPLICVFLKAVVGSSWRNATLTVARGLCILSQLSFLSSPKAMFTKCKQSLTPPFADYPIVCSEIYTAIIPTKEEKLLGADLCCTMATCTISTIYQNKVKRVELILSDVYTTYKVFKKIVDIAQLWQHNRGNYTTPTIYQIKKPSGDTEFYTDPALAGDCRHKKKQKTKKTNKKNQPLCIPQVTHSDSNYLTPKAGTHPLHTSFAKRVLFFFIHHIQKKNSSVFIYFFWGFANSGDSFVFVLFPAIF